MSPVFLSSFRIVGLKSSNDRLLNDWASSTQAISKLSRDFTDSELWSCIPWKIIRPPLRTFIWAFCTSKRCPTLSSLILSSISRLTDCCRDCWYSLMQTTSVFSSTHLSRIISANKWDFPPPRPPWAPLYRTLLGSATKGIAHRGVGIRNVLPLVIRKSHIIPMIDTLRRDGFSSLRAFRDVP